MLSHCILNFNLRRDFADLAIPALLGLAIEPVASLVDTAFVGRRCGEAPLAGVGVAVSIFNILAKSMNFLQSATCSFVARSRSQDAAPGDFCDRSAALAAASISASCGGDDLREILGGKAMRNRHRHAW